MSFDVKEKMLNQRLAALLERHRVYEFVEIMSHPWRLIWRNFVAGLARGLGIGIGFTFLAAIAIYVLQSLVRLNLPVIGDFIADIVEIVQTQLRLRP